MTLFSKLGIDFPIVQAPMAGVSTPRLAAAVSNAGALGSLGLGATNAARAQVTIDELQSLTDRPFNLNFFVHAAPQLDLDREAAWLNALAPSFDAADGQAPTSLTTIYKSFADDDEMLDLLVRTRVPVISFHFGLPSAEKIVALKATGSLLLASATNLSEALAIEAAGLDGIIAQGVEAGGHRGVFDPHLPDEGLSTWVLTRLLVARTSLPVIAAGGIMDGAGIASVMSLGAVGAQLGTAFVPCPESSANEGYRKALLSDAALETRMTHALSGRPARGLRNAFMDWADDHSHLTPPDYPRAYDAAKSLNAAAQAKGEYGFGAQWAGQGAPLARAMPAAELVATLHRELRDARG